MKKRIVIPVVVIMVMTIAGTAMARGGNQRGNNDCFRDGYRNGPAQIFDQFTPEKQQEIKAIFDKHQDELQAIKTQIWAKRTELNALVDSGKADQKTISKLVTEMANLKTKNYNLRKQINKEVETVAGIALPMRGFGPCFGGQGMNDNGPRNNGRRHHNDDRGRCYY